MIIYFSATGNGQYIAKQIANKTNDQAISMVTLLDNGEFNITLKENESLGIVIPTYFWGLPIIVDEYLSQITINSKEVPYIYIITSYGTTPGYSAGFIKEYIDDIGFTVNAMYSIKMPDTWTVYFDLSDDEKVNEKINRADKELEDVIAKITNKTEGNFVKRSLPKFLSNIAQLIYDKNRKTSHLHVENNCITCGICVEGCPVNAIQIENKLPTWITDYCLMCFRCLHRCPEFAIQYNNKTQKHGQYTHPKISIFD